MECTGLSNFINWEDLDSNWESIFLDTELATWEDIQLFDKDFISWENLDLNWEDISNVNGLMCWENIRLISIVAERMRGGSSYGYDDWLNRKNPWKVLDSEIGHEKSEKFIKIYCTINGIEYETGGKLNENISINVSNLEKVFEKANIKVNVRI